MSGGQGDPAANENERHHHARPLRSASPFRRPSYGAKEPHISDSCKIVEHTYGKVSVAEMGFSGRDLRLKPDLEIAAPSKMQPLFSEVEPQSEKVAMQRQVWLCAPLLRRDRYQPKKGTNMPHAIVIGANGRRHEVDFEDAEVTIEVFAGETTIEIVIESYLAPSHRKRFALLNLPRDQFSAALGQAAQRKNAKKTRAAT